MSLFGKIAALFSGGSAAYRVCVVDGERLAGGDRVGPGERFQALARLARFAAREELQIKVVFGGRPLREADEGADYNGVQVFYGESPAQVREKLTKVLSSAGRSTGVLATSDQALESEVSGRGFTTMRLSTIRKAMESSSADGSGGERGGDRGGGRDRDRDGGRRGGRDRRDRRGGDRDRRDRRPQPEGQSSEGGNAPVGEGQGGGQPSAPQGGGSQSNQQDPVKNLIDLVE